MVKLKTTLINEKEPNEGNEYVITTTEEIITAVSGFKGLKVSMKSVNEKDVDEEGKPTKYATILWTRESAGLMSKLGAFLGAFSVYLEKGAEETENWVGHTIGFLQWQPKRREIEVTQ